MSTVAVLVAVIIFLGAFVFQWLRRSAGRTLIAVENMVQEYPVTPESQKVIQDELDNLSGRWLPREARNNLKAVRKLFDLRFNPQKKTCHICGGELNKWNEVCDECHLRQA